MTPLQQSESWFESNWDLWLPAAVMGSLGLVVEACTLHKCAFCTSVHCAQVCILHKSAFCTTRCTHLCVALFSLSRPLRNYELSEHKYMHPWVQCTTLASAIQCSYCSPVLIVNSLWEQCTEITADGCISLPAHGCIALLLWVDAQLTVDIRMRCTPGSF